MPTLRQKISIPDDWDGSSWSCVQLAWPDSPLWLAILRGFISTPAMGRFWDENTGSVSAAQATGFEVVNANIPFNACDGSEIEQPETPAQTTTIRRVIEAFDFEGYEEQIIMSMLCGVNPGNFKIDNGIFYVKAMCDTYPGADSEGWVAIGEMLSPAEAPPNPVPYDDPITPYSACGKASALINVVAAIVETAINNRSSVSQWESIIRAAAPSVTLGRSEIWALLPQLAILDGGLSESEIYNDDLVQEMKCRAEPGMDTSTAEGTDAEVDFVSHSIHSAIAANSTPLALDLIWGVWDRVLVMIGENDRKFLLSTGAQDFDSDCACPGSDGTELWPLETDWYIAYDFRGNLPSYWTLGTDNGITVITGQGAGLEADTAGSDKVNITWNPPVTTGSIKRVRIEFLIDDQYVNTAWVGLGLQVEGAGLYQHDQLEGGSGFYVYEKIGFTTDPVNWYVTAEMDTPAGADPVCVVIQRVVLAGTGAHPLGL